MMASMIFLFIALTSSPLFIFHCYAISSLTIELIHRDSPKSPFYDPTASPSKLLMQAVHRSQSRAARFKAIFDDNKAMSPPVIQADGQYLIPFSVGSPAVKMLAIIDTGSDHIWVQCEPCRKCYPQTYPVAYNSSASDSHDPINCDSQDCDDLKTVSRSISCDQPGPEGLCTYSVQYGDGTFSHGDLAYEEFIFLNRTGSSTYPHHLLFGCGRDSYMYGGVSRAAGVVGLDAGPFSLHRQTGYANFAYCLVPYDSAKDKESTLYFGDDAKIPDGANVTRTPWLFDGRTDFFILTLEAITVGDMRVEYPQKQKKDPSLGSGNMIIDCGTTLTYVDSDFLDRIGSLQDWKFCYYGDEVRDEPIPKLVVNFKEGDVGWDADNAFVYVYINFGFDEYGDYQCLAMVETDDDLGLYGTIAQTNFMVAYDIPQKKVSFRKQTC